MSLVVMATGRQFVDTYHRGEYEDNCVSRSVPRPEDPTPRHPVPSATSTCLPTPASLTVAHLIALKWFGDPGALGRRQQGCCGK